MAEYVLGTIGVSDLKHSYLSTEQSREKQKESEVPLHGCGRSGGRLGRQDRARSESSQLTHAVFSPLLSSDSVATPQTADPRISWLHSRLSNVTLLTEKLLWYGSYARDVGKESARAIIV